MSKNRDVLPIECVVIGAGVVGLAIGRELALAGREVVILEKESLIGSHTSSRNSEVIHAGIYYPQNSLKAELCVRGRKLLYEYCREKKVDHRQCGKLIVATHQEQALRLQQIRDHALNNGVDDLEWLNQDQLQQKEPDLSAVAALWSPSTGIIDSHQYMQQLLADAENAGAQCVLNTEVAAIRVLQDGLELDIGDSQSVIRAKRVINSAGLYAVKVCDQIQGFPKDQIPKAYFARGNYFSYSGKIPFSHLIYPVPEPGGLGTHLTLDLNNRGRFGPDVEWLDAFNGQQSYQVSIERGEKFLQSIRQYWPEAQAERLQADYAGVRPKISGPGEEAADFVIQDCRQHGIDGLVNLFGIESPGLTASLAIAKKVRRSLLPE